MSEAPERIHVESEGGYATTNHPEDRKTWLEGPDNMPEYFNAEYVRADRIEELEAKLAKALDTLEDVNECMFSASLGEYELTSHIEGSLERKNARVFLFRQARTTLAELSSNMKGQDDE